MEKISTLARSFVMMILAISLFSSCTKSAADAPTDEQLGPKETIALPMFDVSNNTEVGSLYIDKMNSGRAQARIEMKDALYVSGDNMKANATLTSSNGTTVYAHCTDLDGKSGKCSTFPIKVLSNNSDAMFSDVTNAQGLVFNVLDKNGNIVARSAKHVIIIDN
jgi:hypothetical protein